LLSIDGAVDARRDLDRVGDAIRRLPPDELETLLLFVWEKLSYAEIAESLEIPVGTVRSRLSRVRRRLQRL
jgi:RNA polymerase sigma-70 factor (ECF subfamily)